MAADNKFAFIKDLRQGMKNVTCVFIVIDKGSVTTTKDGNVVRKCRVADKTASIIFSLWNEQADAIEAGDILRLMKGYASLWKGILMLNSGKYGKLEKVGEFTMVYSEFPDMSDQGQDPAHQLQHPPPSNHSQGPGPPPTSNGTSMGGTLRESRGGGRVGGYGGGFGGNRNGNNNTSMAGFQPQSAALTGGLLYERPSPEQLVTRGKDPRLKEVETEPAPQPQESSYNSHQMSRTFPAPSPHPHFTPHPPPDTRSQLQFPPLPPNHSRFTPTRPPPPFHPPAAPRGGTRYHPYPRPQGNGRLQEPRGIWR